MRTSLLSLPFVAGLTVLALAQNASPIGWGLRTVVIEGEEITRQGIEALREANPHLGVIAGPDIRLRFGPI